MTFAPTTLGSGLGGYAFLTRTRETQQEQFAKSPLVARDTQAVLSRLKEVQTADELMDDYALLKVALGSFGLDDDLNNRAFIKKVLESDLSDRTSLANKLADKRYLKLAETFNFAGEGGPRLPESKSADDVASDLAGIRRAEDLLGDPSLLRATLRSFDLEGDIGNTYFLKSVLESDLSDPRSFANRLSDPRYAELAGAFDLAGKTRSAESIYGFADLVAARDAPVKTAEELLADPDLLGASLKIFGLEADIDRTGFLTAVLTSDLSDPASVANELEDGRYAALAGAFGFPERAAEEAAGRTYESRLETFAATVSSRETPVSTPKEFFSDIPLMLATFEFFDLPARPDGVQFANRILSSDPDSPTSLLNVYPDQRYRAFAEGLGLREATTERTYPPGFAEAIVENYLDRQFEIAIGDQDPTMRFALSMERDLNGVIASAPSNNARWFSVMASKPMREIFETAFQLPASFGTLDIDRQLVDLKARSESYFGTDQVADFAEPERMDELRRLYLARSETTGWGMTSSGSITMTLLAGARG